MGVRSVRVFFSDQAVYPRGETKKTNNRLFFLVPESLSMVNGGDAGTMYLGESSSGGTQCLVSIGIPRKLGT